VSAALDSLPTNQQAKEADSEEEELEGAINGERDKVVVKISDRFGGEGRCRMS
jgi:hypothetical protein